VFKNNSTSGSISIANIQSIAVPGLAGTYGLATGDMNGDGKPDIIVSDNATQIAYLENTSVPGTISFAAAVTIITGASAYPQLAIADVDGDNKPDIIAASGSNIVIFKNTMGEAGEIGTKQSICYNTKPAALTSISAANFTTGTASYKWQISTTSATTGFTDISGATAVGYTIPANLYENTWYRRAAASSVSPATWLYSTPVMITVIPSPTINSSTGTYPCGNSSSTIVAIPSAGTVNWYSASTGGTLLAINNSYTTAVAVETGFYAEAVTAEGCKSSYRTSVWISPELTKPNVTASSRARCENDTIILKATSSGNWGVIKWYNAAMGGDLLYTGTTFTTPVLSSTTTYYAEASNCNGASARKAVEARILTTPSITSAPSVLACYNENVVLTATSSGGSLSWYIVPAGGISSSSNNTVTMVQANTARYVSALNQFSQPVAPYATTTCESPRTTVSVKVNNLPTVSTSTPGSITGMSTATLNATSANGTIVWYDALTGGIPLGTGNSFTTPLLSAAKTYYAAAKNAFGCESSPRTAVAVTYNGPTVSPISDVTALTNSTNQSFKATTLTGQASFIWQRSLDRGNTWVDITATLDPGVTYSGFSGTTASSSSLTLSVALANYHGTQYRLKLVHTSGAFITSNAATLYVADVFGGCTGGASELTKFPGIPLTAHFSSAKVTTVCSTVIRNPRASTYSGENAESALWDGNTEGTGVAVSAASPAYIGLDLGTIYLIDKVQCQGIWNWYLPTATFCVDFNTGNLETG
jgi:hypothetical protein